MVYLTRWPSIQTTRTLTTINLQIGPVAQWLERGTHNALVESSILSRPTQQTKDNNMKKLKQFYADHQRAITLVAGTIVTTSAVVCANVIVNNYIPLSSQYITNFGAKKDDDIVGFILADGAHYMFSDNPI
jgi:hypothetical protein